MDSSRDERIERLAEHLALSRRDTPRGLSERIQLAILRDQAERVADWMEGFAAGELRYLGFDDAWGVIGKIRASATVRQMRCALRCHELRNSDSPLAGQIASALGVWLQQTPGRIDGTLVLLWESELDIVKDPEFLDVAFRGREAGWRVFIGVDSGRAPVMEMTMRTAGSQRVTLTLQEHGAAGSRDGSGWLIRLGPAHTEDVEAQGSGSRPSDELVLPSDGTRRERATAVVETIDAPRAVTDVFGARIALRDLEPRDATLPGLEQLHKELSLEDRYIPRKNEPAYGQVLMRIIAGLRPTGPEQIVFVGDTLLNDGGAIRGLQQASDPSQDVWGFLCGATPAPQRADFVLNRVYFASEWSGLSAFFDYAIRDGLRLDSGTAVLFDLDQTVYAAKRRDDAALHLARWEATREYLERIVPAYRFDAKRAEAMYREFDRDDYHPVTRDNLDYVVLLVLAVASGLADATEIKTYATSTRPSIGALADELHRRALIRRGHEEIDNTLAAIKEVLYNTIAGDQTPCKRFRRFECLAMARRMSQTGDGAVVLNREVLEAIDFLQRRGVMLMAFSDRPVEAAVLDADDEEGPVDLMSVSMVTRGSSISDDLEHVVL
jgi:hypothetical protein